MRHWDIVNSERIAKAAVYGPEPVIGQVGQAPGDAVVEKRVVVAKIAGRARGIGVLDGTETAAFVDDVNPAIRAVGCV